MIEFHFANAFVSPGRREADCQIGGKEASALTTGGWRYSSHSLFGSRIYGEYTDREI